jgi:hypothetical protein
MTGLPVPDPVSRAAVGVRVLARMARPSHGAAARTRKAVSRGTAAPRDEEADAKRMRLRLVRETGRGETEVKLAVDVALEQFRGASIREFVMVLAERDARRRLLAPPDRNNERAGDVSPRHGMRSSDGADEDRREAGQIR